MQRLRNDIAPVRFGRRGRAVRAAMGRVAIPFDRPQKDGARRRHVASRHGRPQAVQLFLQLGGFEEGLVGLVDPRVLGRFGVRADQKLLIELLARSQTGIDDLDVAVGIVVVTRTGSPICRTNTSPPLAMEPACTTRAAASGIDMK
jgi:hypothetical protein